MVRRAVLAALREGGRWLLVFDNAEHPEDVLGWLPGGGGHVLITSREHRWAEVAVPVEVDVLARAESVAILQAHPVADQVTDDNLQSSVACLLLTCYRRLQIQGGSGW